MLFVVCCCVIAEHCGETLQSYNDSEQNTLLVSRHINWANFISSIDGSKIYQRGYREPLFSRGREISASDAVSTIIWRDFSAQNVRFFWVLFNMQLYYNGDIGGRLALQ